jgi:hypothetical protein
MRAMSIAVSAAIFLSLSAAAAMAGTSDTPGAGTGTQGTQRTGTPTGQGASGGTPMARGTGGTGDLNGLWYFSTSGHTSSGVCPPGKPGIGKLTISQSGSAIDLKLISGAVCKPASVCSYSGSVSGGRVSVANSASVDDEGGRVSNRLELSIVSDERMQGSSSSQYTHPEGPGCSWSSEMEAERVLPNRTASSAPGSTTPAVSGGGSSGQGGTSGTGGQGGTSGTGGEGGNTTGSGGGSSGQGGTSGTGG